MEGNCSIFFVFINFLRFLKANGMNVEGFRWIRDNNCNLANFVFRMSIGFIRSGFIPSTSTCLEAIYGSRSGIFDRNIDFSPNRLCSSPLRGWLQIMNFNLENYWKNSKNSLHAVNIEKGHWKARTLSKYLEEAVEIYANHKRMYKK